MKNLMLIAVMLTVAFATLPVTAAELGDPAGALQISEWVKGDAFKLEDVKGKKPVVVEFWATWCGPCRTSIPHLTEMAKKFKDKAIFVGVSDEEVDVVKPFVEKMGDQMDYVVAVDKDGATNKAYMKAYGEGGIPHAFIVDKEGRIAWHAHPMEPSFELALEQIVAGTFDPDKLVAAAEAEKAAQKHLEEIFTEYFNLSGTSEADKRFAEIEKEFREIMWTSAQQLDALAWNIASKEWKYQNLKFALSAAERAMEVSEGKNGSVLDTYARVLWELGRTEEAIEYAKKAIAAANSDSEKEFFQKALDMYQAE